MMRRSVALLLVLTGFLVPPVQADDVEPAPWVIEDDAGDAYLVKKDAGVQPPPTPLSAYADLDKIELTRETEEALEFAFVFADLKPYEEGIYGAWLSEGQDEFFFSFDVKGAPVHYDVKLSVRHGSTSEPPGVGSTLEKWGERKLCIRTGQQGCFPQPVQASMDYQQNAIRLSIPKAALLGLAGKAYSYGPDYDGGPGGAPDPVQPPQGTPTRLGPGDTLEKFRFTYDSTRGSTAVGFYEEAPNSGEAPVYPIRTITANQDVGFQSSRDAFEVEIGARTTLEVTMENRANFKRIVNLTHALEGAPEATSKVHVKLPPTLTLPRGRPVNLSIVVDVDPALPITQALNLTLRGQSIGHPDEVAFIRLPLVPSTPLSVRNPNFYFHARSHGSSTQVIQPHCLVVTCTDLYLSPLKDDPREDPQAEHRARLSASDKIEATISAHSWESMPSPVALEGEKPLVIKMKLKSPVDATLHAKALIVTRAFTLGEAEQDIQVSPAGSLVEIPVTPSAPNLIIPEGFDGWMEFEVTFEAEPDNPAGVAALASQQLVLIPKESLVAFPVTELPETLLSGSPLAPFTLQIPEERREDFVNADEARLFNVTILNRGERTDTVHIRGTLDQPNWKLQLLPGDAFRLNPGESITLGVLVGAPANAAEGAVVAVRLNATSEALPEEAAFLRLTLTVTNNIPLGDDSGLFRADADTEEKLLDNAASRHNTPGFEALTLAAALLVFVRRRRRFLIQSPIDF